MMTPLRKFKSFLNIGKEHINQVKSCDVWFSLEARNWTRHFWSTFLEKGAI